MPAKKRFSEIAENLKALFIYLDDVPVSWFGIRNGRRARLVYKDIRIFPEHETEDFTWIGHGRFHLMNCMP
jgi:hypothetical protein